MTPQKHARGELFDHPWLLDAQGTPTRDPAVLEHSEPRGSMQFLGGVESGPKGFGLALMVEALSQGLSGDKAARSHAQARADGLALDAAVWAGLQPWAEKLAVALPPAM